MLGCGIGFKAHKELESEHGLVNHSIVKETYTLNVTDIQPIGPSFTSFGHQKYERSKVITTLKQSWFAYSVIDCTVE